MVHKLLRQVFKVMALKLRMRPIYRLHNFKVQYEAWAYWATFLHRSSQVQPRVLQPI